MYNLEKREQMNVIADVRGGKILLYELGSQDSPVEDTMVEGFEAYDNNTQPIPQHRLEQLVEIVRGTR